MGYARYRTATFTAANQQGPWCSMKKGGVLTLSGTWSGTVTLLRRGADGNTVTATTNADAAITFTANGTYTLSPDMVQAEYAVKCTSYNSGNIVTLLEGK